MRSRWSPPHKAKTNAISYDGSPVGTKLPVLAHTFCRGPTRIRPATAGASERDLQWRCFHKVKRGNTPASGWLHRLVERSRCAGRTILGVMERPEFQTPGYEK